MFDLTKLTEVQLRRRYDALDRDISAQTLDEECRRMKLQQDVADELIRRGLVVGGLTAIRPKARHYGERYAGDMHGAD